MERNVHRGQGVFPVDLLPFPAKKEWKNNLSLQKDREKVGLKYSLKALKQR